jgi:hypothetical protein
MGWHLGGAKIMLRVTQQLDMATHILTRLSARVRRIIPKATFSQSLGSIGA